MALSRGFPRVGVTDHPCPVMSGLSSKAHHLRDCSASKVKHNSVPRVTPKGFALCRRARGRFVRAALRRDVSPVLPCDGMWTETR